VKAKMRNEQNLVSNGVYMPAIKLTKQWLLPCFHTWHRTEIWTLLACFAEEFQNHSIKRDFELDCFWFSLYSCFVLHRTWVGSRFI